MSNVIRSLNKVVYKGETRQIGIRNLHVNQKDSAQQELTVQDVLAERDHLMSEAYRSLEEEKLAIETMRLTATEDIAAMHKAWEDEKPKLEQKAYDEGFQTGYEEGRKKVTAEMATSVSLANQTTVLSEKNANEYIAEKERVILEIAMQSAERIIGLKLEEDEEIFLSVVRRAIKEVREMKTIKVYVSTTYFELVSNNRDELSAIFPPEVPFLLFVNEDIEATECFIETNHGRIVVGIDDQLNELREQLIELLENGG
ncbi:flagellar assembly protein FliH [Sporosarcina sp. CAU 1771]